MNVPEEKGYNPPTVPPSSEDPEFTDEPKLYIVMDEPLAGDLFNEIRALEFVRKIELE